MVKRMSDRAKSDEVEETLSSIRRMVSEDSRPPEDRKPQPDVPDHFVLSPSLRVSDEADRSPGDTVDREMTPLRLASAQRVGAGGDQTLLQLGEDRRVRAGTEPAASGELPGGAPQDGPAKRAQNVPPGAGASTLEQKIEALEAALNEPPSETTAVVPGADFFAKTAPPPPTEVNAQDAETKEGEADQPDPASEDTPDTITKASATQAMGSAPKAADRPSLDRQTPTPAAVRRRPIEQIIDEEALCELIRETVRAELDGVLSSEINRNLRKLVRREIHRALAAQDLE